MPPRDKTVNAALADRARAQERADAEVQAAPAARRPPAAEAGPPREGPAELSDHLELDAGRDVPALGPGRREDRRYESEVDDWLAGLKRTVLKGDGEAA
jgi:hypothetical protein